MIAILWMMLVKTLSDKCLLPDPFPQRIKQFLAPFSEGLTRDYILAAKEEKYLCLVEIEQGTVFGDCLLPQWREYFQSVAPSLPDVLLQVNQMDCPRVVKNSCADTKDTWMTCACDKDYIRPHHAFFHSHNNWTPIFKKYPIFSPTTIPECFLDIILPTIYHLQPYVRKKEVNWPRAKDAAYWRGSTTGGDWKPKGPHYSISHRHQFIARCLQLQMCDARFTSFIQCQNPVCAQMQKQYGGTAPFVDFNHLEEQYKIYLDIDGNTYSARFNRLLQTGSIVLKLGAFTDFVTMATRPWMHYIPARMDLGDFEQKIDWILQNEEEIKQIGKAGRAISQQLFNTEVYKCYLIHLITQYHNLFKEEPENFTNRTLQDQPQSIDDIPFDNQYYNYDFQLQK